MIVSEARIAANRANALKSTGPKTEQGKERSRCNAFRHGMTGESVALPPGEADEVERRLDGFEAQFRPATEAGKALVRRAALLSVRLERCAVHESAAISLKVRAAEADFDEAREAEVDLLMATIADDPAPTLRRLMRMPEGVERMAGTWRDLRADLDHGDGSRWTSVHSATALHLTGRKPGGIGIARVEALSRAIGGDFSLLGPDEAGGPSQRDRARRELIALIDEELARLGAHRETIDFEAIAADRAGAGALALFDPSKAATLARKYEAAAERGMHRALKEMRAVEAEAADRAEPAPIFSPPLASFSPPAPARPAPTPSPVAPVSPMGDPAGSSFVPMTIGRPPIRVI